MGFLCHVSCLLVQVHSRRSGQQTAVWRWKLTYGYETRTYMVGVALGPDLRAIWLPIGPDVLWSLDLRPLTCMLVRM